MEICIIAVLVNINLLSEQFVSVMVYTYTYVLNISYRICQMTVMFTLVSLVSPPGQCS